MSDDEIKQSSRTNLANVSLKMAAPCVAINLAVGVCAPT